MVEKDGNPEAELARG